MVWMTNAVTVPVDVFPTEQLGSVHGMIGTGGALGGLLTQIAVGYLVTHYSYTPVFIALGLLHPAATIMLAVLLPRIVRRTADELE